MANRVNDGGPAFPFVVHENWRVTCEGMTLRDYFAAKADVSVYDPVGTYIAANGHRPTVDELAEYIASIRFTEADAMLLARGAQCPTK